MTQPSFIPKPWASGSSAQSGTIPETTTQASSGYASWDLGFPPSTALAMDAGGVPPRYLDFQGVLKAISQHICFQQAGATYTWSNTLDYPLGAIVLGSDNKLYIAIQASTAASAKDPTTETAYWKKLDVDASISTHNSSSTAHSDIRGLVSTAQSTADSASTTANAALPTSGGTMTGELTFGSSSDGIFSNRGEVSINGGSNMHLYQGAGLLLCGESHASMAGQFVLRAAIDSSTYRDLIGTPSGSLTWDGNEVLTAAGGAMTGTITQSNSLMLTGNGGAGNNYYIGAEPTLHAGARIRLNVAQTGTVNTGVFELVAVRDNTEAYLNGDASGTLQWNGQPIQTSSDATLKQDASAVPDADLDAWAAMDWQRFRFKADVARKGSESARYHTGLLAQNAISAVTSAGGTPLSYGIFCKMEDEKDENGNVTKEGKWTVRYEEALAMEAAYLRREVARLKARLDALETPQTDDTDSTEEAE